MHPGTQEDQRAEQRQTDRQGVMRGATCEHDSAGQHQADREWSETGLQPQAQDGETMIRQAARDDERQQRRGTAHGNECDRAHPPDPRCATR